MWAFLRRRCNRPTSSRSCILLRSLWQPHETVPLRPSVPSSTGLDNTYTVRDYMKPVAGDGEDRPISFVQFMLILVITVIILLVLWLWIVEKQVTTPIPGHSPEKPTDNGFMEDFPGPPKKHQPDYKAPTNRTSETSWLNDSTSATYSTHAD